MLKPVSQKKVTFGDCRPWHFEFDAPIHEPSAYRQHSKHEKVLVTVSLILHVHAHTTTIRATTHKFVCSDSIPSCSLHPQKQKMSQANIPSTYTRKSTHHTIYTVAKSRFTCDLVELRSQALPGHRAPSWKTVVVMDYKHFIPPFGRDPYL